MAVLLLFSSLIPLVRMCIGLWSPKLALKSLLYTFIVLDCLHFCFCPSSDPTHGAVIPSRQRPCVIHLSVSYAFQWLAWNQKHEKHTFIMCVDTAKDREVSHNETENQIYSE